MNSAPSTYFTYNTPVGHITIAATAQAITHIILGKQTLAAPHKATALTNNAANQIQEYLAGKRSVFDLPLAPEGTPFQHQVWDELRAIPYGQTCSCSALAAAIDKPKSQQAVGVAAHKNPLAIVVPSHRLVGAAGKPLGSAAEIKTKEFLLNREQTRPR
ncbi:MAG: methylated-DNA--[protein]-cysteine S-methyltransferase [Raoultibacter sp.]